MAITIILNIDRQGRIIIPSEIRKTMNLTEGDPLELTTSNDHLLLRKYDYVDDKEIQHHLDILFKTIQCSVAATSGTRIIASRGIYVPVGTEISAELADYVSTHEQWILEEPVSATTYKRSYVDTIIPFGSGMSLLLFQKKKHAITDSERMAAQLIAALLTGESHAYAR